MINGVLVERTVKDVVPALKVNSEGLKKVLEDLVKQYNKQQSDMEKWKVRSLAHFAILGQGLMCVGGVEKEQHSGCAAMNYMVYFCLSTAREGRERKDGMVGIST